MLKEQGSFNLVKNMGHKGPVLRKDASGSEGLEPKYEGDSISKLQIVIEKNRMEIMTYKQHLFFNIISIQI